MNAPMRARSRTQLKRVSLDANKHQLSIASPLRGRVVGSLSTEVLEDQKLVLKKLKLSLGHAGEAQVDADLKAIESELARRWLAFTT